MNKVNYSKLLNPITHRNGNNFIVVFFCFAVVVVVVVVRV